MLNPTISALVKFFDNELPRLTTTYQWPIPAIDGFPLSGKVGYQENLDLKRHLHQRWNLATQEERVSLARVIVSDWGGVRGNRPSTLRRYVEAIAEPIPKTPLKGVASYSKIFSIARPEKFSIYDARVAACLNAVQINAGIRKGVAFNYVPGRNNLVGNIVTKKGFTQIEKFSVRSLVKSGWTLIKRDETYSKYIEVLSRCLELLPNSNRTELEMALFSNAEQQCQMAMSRQVLSEVCERFNRECHAYCLMSNHYHLLIETPDANLSQGTRQLNGVYTQRFNRAHGRLRNGVLSLDRCRCMNKRRLTETRPLSWPTIAGVIA